MRYKMFITYLFLIAIPFTAFILINYHITSKDLENQALYSSRQVFEQGRSYMEYRIDTVRTYMSVIATNDKIQEVIRKDPSVYNENYGLWGFDLSQIRKQFLNARPSSDISQIRLYLNNSITSVDETDDFMKLTRISDMDWYKRLINRKNTFEWFNGEEVTGIDKHLTKFISSVRTIPNIDSLQEILGIVRIDIPENSFITMLDHVAFFKSSPVFLINNDKEIICTSSTTTKKTDTAFASEIIGKYSIDNLKEGIWSKFKLNNENFLVGIQNVAGTDWNLVITVPYKVILSWESKTMQQMLLVIMILIPLTLPLAFIAATSGTKRIRKLISHMRTIQKGDFNVSVLPGSKDEIGELTRNFNSMITKIAMLLDEKYKMGQEIKSIELKALQAQINPHFLYNTLDLIYWKALRVKENSISDLVLSLTKFYRLSLSKGNDIVTLENEIEHIKAYVQIQNARYKNGITLIINIPESLYQYKIPKITLQPMIENSIIHGILEKKEEKGTIIITGYTDINQIILEVADSGVGIPEEKMVSILDMECSDSSHGYGISNINKRIKLLYGEEYGLSYESKQGFGTTVRIILPENGITLSS